MLRILWCVSGFVENLAEQWFDLISFGYHWYHTSWHLYWYIFWTCVFFFFLCVIFQISGAIFSFRLKTSWIYVCNFQHELNVLSLFHFVFDQLEVCVTGSLGGVPVDLFIVGPSGAPPRDPSHNGETQFAQCGVEVGTMFGHLVGFVGFLHGFWNWKMNPNKNFLFLMFILEALEELCRTNAGPMSVHMVSMLGPCWIIWWAMVC